MADMISFAQYLAERPEDESLIDKDRVSTYGQELILDLHNVPAEVFHKDFIRKFAEQLCDRIGMRRGPGYLWGTEKELRTMDNPKADGISCCQFLYSSSIVIHAIDELSKVFINIFSCQDFEIETAKSFVLENLGGIVVAEHNIVRK